MDVNFNTRTGFGQVGVPGAEVAPQAAPPPAEKESVRTGGAIYDVARATAGAAAADVAGLEGAEAISEKDLDRKDDLGLLFARAFGAALPAMPDWPDP